VPPVECHPAVTAASRRALLKPGDAKLFDRKRLLHSEKEAFLIHIIRDLS